MSGEQTELDTGHPGLSAELPFGWVASEGPLTSMVAVKWALLGLSGAASETSIECHAGALEERGRRYAEGSQERRDMNMAAALMRDYSARGRQLRAKTFASEMERLDQRLRP